MERSLSAKSKSVPGNPPAIIQAKDFQKLREMLEQSKRILISTHMLPDGDGLGAEAALFHYLKRSRKACRIYNPDNIPKRYKFLDP